MVIDFADDDGTDYRHVAGSGWCGLDADEDGASGAFDQAPRVAVPCPVGLAAAVRAIVGEIELTAAQRIQGERQRCGRDDPGASGRDRAETRRHHKLVQSVERVAEPPAVNDDRCAAAVEYLDVWKQPTDDYIIKEESIGFAWGGVLGKAGHGSDAIWE